jgi:hypothetical protein
MALNHMDGGAIYLHIGVVRNDRFRLGGQTASQVTDAFRLLPK